MLGRLVNFFNELFLDLKKAWADRKPAKAIEINYAFFSPTMNNTYDRLAREEGVRAVGFTNSSVAVKSRTELVCPSVSLSLNSVNLELENREALRRFVSKRIFVARGAMESDLKLEGSEVKPFSKFLTFEVQKICLSVLSSKEYSAVIDSYVYYGLRKVNVFYWTASDAAFYRRVGLIKLKSRMSAWSGFTVSRKLSVFNSKRKPLVYIPRRYFVSITFPMSGRPKKVILDSNKVSGSVEKVAKEESNRVQSFSSKLFSGIRDMASVSLGFNDVSAGGVDKNLISSVDSSRRIMKNSIGELLFVNRFADVRRRLEFVNSVDSKASLDGVDFQDSSAVKPNNFNSGVVVSYKDGVVIATGLKSVRVNELIYFRSGATGVALNLEVNVVKALVFKDNGFIKAGERIFSSGFLLRIGVGDALLGRVINPLGVALDGLGTISGLRFFPIERKAPGVITRKKVSQPLHTGIRIIDSLVPIGRGQRELILGDRKTGKTSIVLDTFVNQTWSVMEGLCEPVICIYVLIGKKMSELVRITKLFKETNSFENIILVAASASDSAPLQYIAPYSACTIGESYAFRGRHAVIAYDDLTRHADAYRQISLLLRRPVGREAYPGDIFYLHSRLLERAVKLSRVYGGGSLTALPIVETLQGDVSAYVPTNIISITDGQIYLDFNRHQEGFRPAVDPGLSVSRVGSSAQSAMMKKLAGSLKLTLALFRELEGFAKLGSELDRLTKQIIFRGRLISSFLIQYKEKPSPELKQLLSFTFVNSYFFEWITGGGSVNIDLDPYFESLDDFIDFSLFLAPRKWNVLYNNLAHSAELVDSMKIHYLLFFFKSATEVSGLTFWDRIDSDPDVTEFPVYADIRKLFASGGLNTDFHKMVLEFSTFMPFENISLFFVLRGYEFCVADILSPLNVHRSILGIFSKLTDLYI